MFTKLYTHSYIRLFSLFFLDLLDFLADFEHILMKVMNSEVSTVPPVDFVSSGTNFQTSLTYSVFNMRVHKSSMAFKWTSRKAESRDT